MQNIHNSLLEDLFHSLWMKMKYLHQERNYLGIVKSYMQITMMKIELEMQTILFMKENLEMKLLNFYMMEKQNYLDLQQKEILL